MYLKVDNKKAYAYTANHPFDAAKPTVAFIHGAAHDHSVWALQSRYFAYHGWNALAVDLPGHGKSEGKALNRIGDIADWVARVLDAARTLDPALSADPADYLLDNFHFNNEVFGDGEIGINLADYKVELIRR